MDKKKVLWVVVLVLIVAVVAVLGVKMNKGNGYSVVYLSTGEVYVGKLTTFPDMQLKDAYIYQVTKDATDATKANFQLQPVREALWSPKSIHLIKENVVFYGPLMPDSKIAQTLAGQTAK